MTDRAGFQSGFGAVATGGTPGAVRGGGRGGPRGRGRGGPRGRGGRGKDDKEWVPVTKLGRLVKERKIMLIEDIYLHSLPIKVFGYCLVEWTYLMV